MRQNLLAVRRCRTSDDERLVFRLRRDLARSEQSNFDGETGAIHRRCAPPEVTHDRKAELPVADPQFTLH
jgi:hypothetical protein